MEGLNAEPSPTAVPPVGAVADPYGSLGCSMGYRGSRSGVVDRGRVMDCNPPIYGKSNGNASDKNERGKE